MDTTYERGNADTAKQPQSLPSGTGIKRSGFAARRLSLRRANQARIRLLTIRNVTAAQPGYRRMWGSA
jgi:hypothetical protein